MKLQEIGISRFTARDTISDFSELLGEEGKFAERLSGFTPRPAQQRLAGAVGDALARQEHLIAEAGTGTGKTFAYLVPALVSGKRILVSTGTRMLQDQLYLRDLPSVSAVLGMPVKVALLKGRSNYLCRHRLGLTLHGGEGLFDSGERRQELLHVKDWAANTRSGEIAELSRVPENSPVWPHVTSTTENCLGQSCPDYAQCFVVDARRRAQEADILVVNHHLLLSDMVLREEGFGALLPGVDAVIADEAHQLPDTATQYFGASLSSFRLYGLLRDAHRDYLDGAGDLPGFKNLLQAAAVPLVDLQALLVDVRARVDWQDLAAKPGSVDVLHRLHAGLQDLAQALEVLAERSAGLKNCQQRMTSVTACLSEFLEPHAEDQSVRWIDRHNRGFSLNLTPLDAPSRFQACMRAADCTWVFVSASLSVNGEFGHFRERLGLTEIREVLLGSAFDYEHHTLMYLPDGLPDVAAPGYTAAVVRAALPVVRASGGRAFLLFTSHRALKEAADLMRGQCEFPLLVQGESPRRRLLDNFRDRGNAVLLGTASFWEGVDVKGPALSVVLIDRLPFAPPGDPVIKARFIALTHQGRDPFLEYELPRAVLALKQGVGRLIRDEADTGVLVLCDPRVTRRAYGKLFLNSLPPMPRTRSLEEVQEFLARVLPAHPSQAAR